MKAEYLNPFLDAFHNVILQVINVEPVNGKVYIKEGSQKSGEVVINIGVTGDLSGTVLMSMSEETAKQVASKMMMGMEVKNFDDMAKSAISELGNMIAGNAATYFPNLGNVINITPPTLYTGSNMSIYTYKSKTLCVPISINELVVEMDISIN